MSDHQACLAACAIIDPLIERKPLPRAVLTREALLKELGIRSLLRALMALDFIAAPDHPAGFALMNSMPAANGNCLLISTFQCRRDGNHSSMIRIAGAHLAPLKHRRCKPCAVA